MSEPLKQRRVPGRLRGVTRAVLALSGFGALGLAGPCYGVEFETGPDLKMRWDNTVKYSAAWRVKGLDEAIAADVNLDDGDRNFKKGLVSNRVDLFSEFDLTYKNIMGVRISGAAWYDDVYNRSNDNPGGTANVFSVPQNEFTDSAKRIMGRKAEFLDAFVFLRNDPSAATAYTVRAGRHSVLYGESLFFGSNGIANAQSPVDLIKLLSVPSSQFKEIIRPVGQVSTQIQLSPRVSVGAYYQYEWEKTRLPASGSYLSDADFVGPGAERFLVSPSAAGPAFFVTEQSARDSGQGGLQLRFRPSAWDVEFGLYAARYHDKGPQLYVRPTGLPPEPGTLRVGDLQQVYAEDIKTYGASFSTVLGEANVAGEMSYRTNAPLVSDPQVALPGVVADGRDNPFFAVGKTAHAQVSFIYLLGNSPLWDGAELLGEVAWNRRLSVTKNPAAIDPNTTRDAWALRILFVPQFFQVFPGVDLTMPIGIGYNPSGRSSAVFKFNGGVEKGGDFSIGLTADYAKKVKAGVTYTHFYGRTGPFLEPTNAFGAQRLSYDQSLKDRDFISLSVQMTF